MKISLNEIKDWFNQFKKDYNAVEKGEIWATLSSDFRRFWNERVITSGKQIEDNEVDPIIRILDWNAKGNRGPREAVARAMIAQGAWRRMFNELHRDNSLQTGLDHALKAKNDEERIKAINTVYKLNKDRKNNLTGPSGNAINTMLAAFDPVSNLSMISLGDRVKFLESIDVPLPEHFEEKSQGHRMVVSQNLINDYFRKLGSNDSARTISEFIYSPQIKAIWRESEQPEIMDIDEETHEEQVIQKNIYSDSNKFYIEKQLEDFIIENWENTEFGKKFDLIQEGDKFSQQYPTKIGKIDILAKEKESNKYVIIELKKGKTSDDVIGQIARYLGWVSAHKSKDVRGIIVTSEPDEKLHYALKQIKNVELWIYKVDFHLTKIQTSED